MIPNFTDWFSITKHLPAVRRLHTVQLDNVKENKHVTELGLSNDCVNCNYLITGIFHILCFLNVFLVSNFAVSVRELPFIAVKWLENNKLINHDW